VREIMVFLHEHGVGTAPRRWPASLLASYLLAAERRWSIPPTPRVPTDGFSSLMTR
jgi:hypothetical protein